MGRRLRMTAELGDWLTDLGGSDPAAAAEVGAALVAVMESAEPSGLAIVGVPGKRAERAEDDPRAEADYAYQRQLEELQRLRREVADAATAARAAEAALSAQQGGADAAVIATLAERLAAAELREAAITEATQRIQTRVDAFRTEKETAKALYTAAEAQLRIAELTSALSPADDDRAAALQAARDRLRALAYPFEARGVVIRHSGSQRAGESPRPPRPPDRDPEPVRGLLDLHADPLGSGVRILFAVEPADTVTLLAVLEDPEAIREHGSDAIRLAGDLLAEIRDPGWPADLDEVALDDAAAFVARFVPADDGSITRRAGILAGSVRLSRLRADQKMTVAELADQSGVDAHRIDAIDREGLRIALVHEAVALARVLGARLELPAGSGPVLAD